MTFCLAFSANPDGIAVVADTRLTFYRRYEDDFQKVIFPTDNSIVCVAGSVRTLRHVLHEISPYLQAIAPPARASAFRARIKERFAAHLSTLSSPDKDDAAAVIYGDIRLGSGPLGARLHRLDLRVQYGRPLFSEATAREFADARPRNFQMTRAYELPWLCIGAYESLRDYLGNTAMGSIRDLCRRSLAISRAELSIGDGLVPYQRMEFRGSTVSQVPGAFVFSSAGRDDGTFRNRLREYVRMQLRLGEQPVLDPIYVLGSAAMKAIESHVEEFRRGAVRHIDTIGSAWTFATISRDQGIKLSTGPDAAGLTLNFSVKSGLG